MSQVLRPGEPHRVDLELHPDEALDEIAWKARACARAGLDPREVRCVVLERRAIDARRGRVRVNLRAAVWVHDDPPPMAHLEPLPQLHGEPEVIVVGSGPAGLFCAHALARAGVRSRLLERGRRIRNRRQDLARLSQKGELDPDSNYCFGEGGAGTFSDGKLYTRAQKRGSVSTVLELLAAHGAPPEILVDARPHIGTNRLPRVITSMREALENAGVLVEFETCVESLALRDGKIAGVILRDQTVIPARAVVLAPGHSAGDLLREVARLGASVEFKPFAMGVRIEHSQAAIDRIQFGDLAGHPALGPANYRLAFTRDKVGVWSFCMCPGGYIVAAATEAGRQVVNGMSPSSRRGRFANSGFVVDVGMQRLREAGFSADDPFAGLEYQRQLETRAYQAGGGGFRAPAQTLRDFAEGTRSEQLPLSSYHRGLASADLGGVLGDLSLPLRRALSHLDRIMPGFVSHEAVAVGVESRTSCPVRLRRDPTSAESSIPGLFPCGEGAGYAGGIVSAALDGLGVAASVVRAMTHSKS